MDAGTSNAVLVAHLKALNRTWCIHGTINNDGEPTNANTDGGIGADDRQRSKRATLTPLDKARIGISKLPIEVLTTSDSIVPHLFSVLREKYSSAKTEADEKDPVASSSSSQSLPHRTNNNSITEYELRQMEWHIVLLLEFWSCASQQSTKTTGNGSQKSILDILSDAIKLSGGQSQQKDRNNKRKKKKRTRKKDKNVKDPQNLALVTSKPKKETLILEHLVQVLSRAPFLLPRDLPLSEFLIGRIFTRERHFWERLPRIVSHIYEAFEIPNPFLRKAGDGDSDEGIIDRSLLLSSFYDDTQNDGSRQCLSTGYKKQDAVERTAKKRKPSRRELLEIAKNKKRQRLVSLTSKKKHRGSHFHSNLDDISKLLNKTRAHSTISTKIHKSKATKSSLKSRKTSTDNSTRSTGYPRSEKDKPSTRKTIDHEKRNDSRLNIDRINRGKDKSSAKCVEITLRQSRPKVSSRPKKFSKQASSQSSSTNLVESIFEKEGKNNVENDDSGHRGVGGSSNIETVPMTPRKSLRASDTAITVGETPVPKGSTRLEAVVGETPVASEGSRALETIVGETPTYGNNFVGATPMSSSSEHLFFSPPVLPSPTKLTTVTNAPQHPTKLFGTVKLLKRTNSIGSRGKMKSWDGNIQNHAFGYSKRKASSALEEKNGCNRDVGGSSSIDMARAYLRRKSL